MITITECPICANELSEPAIHFQSRPYYTSHVQGITFLSCAFVTYAHCSQCGAYVQTPRMTDDDVNTYYRSGMYRQWLGVSQDSLDADEAIRANQDAEHILQWVGTPASHLDIGSSRGMLLQKIGASVQVGVEPNAEYNRNDAAQIIPEMENVRGKFALVTMIHALEHVVNPMQVMKGLHEFVLDGGKLVIEVPSNDSPGGWGRLAHLYHFPEWTMHYLASHSGWRVIAMLHTPHTFVVMEKA